MAKFHHIICYLSSKIAMIPTIFSGKHVKCLEVSLETMIWSNSFVKNSCLVADLFLNKLTKTGNLWETLTWVSTSHIHVTNTTGWSHVCDKVSTLAWDRLSVCFGLVGWEGGSLGHYNFIPPTPLTQNTHIVCPRLSQHSGYSTLQY